MDVGGRGLLLVWTDVAPEAEAAFNAWYDRDHARERVERVPGMYRVRRFVAEADGPKYLAAYDLTNPAVMRTEPYLDLRRTRDPESQQLIPQFRNTLKLVGRVDAGFERAEGGLCMLVRSEADASGPAREALEAVLARAATTEGLVAARLATSDEGLVAQTRTYTTRSQDRFLDWVLMLEATEEAALEAATAPLADVPGLGRTLLRFRYGLQAPR